MSRMLGGVDVEQCWSARAGRGSADQKLRLVLSTHGQAVNSSNTTSRLHQMAIPSYGDMYEAMLRLRSYFHDVLDPLIQPSNFLTLVPAILDSSVLTTLWSDQKLISSRRFAS